MLFKKQLVLMILAFAFHWHFAEAFNMAITNEVLYAQSAGNINFGQITNFFGQSVTMADLDRDSDLDLLIGQPGAAVMAIEEVGGFHMLFLGPNNSVTQEFDYTGLGDMQLIGENFELASSIAWMRTDPTGDIIFAMGSPTQNVVFVVNATASLSYFTQILITLLPSTSGSTFGEGLASLGDFDGDGGVDLAVGAPQIGSGSTGFVDVVLLRADFTVATTSRILAADLVPGDRFGFSVTNIGDFNNDGIIDLAVGAPGVNLDSGAVYIVFLTSLAGVSSSLRIDSATAGLTRPPLPADMMGIGVASLGDFDFDGVGDLLVGIPNDSRNITGVVTILLLNIDGTVKDQITPTFSSNLTSSSSFGYSVAHTATNNLATIAVGAPFLGAGPSLVSSGEVYLITFARCGDGLITASNNEICDDGNALAGDGCNALCVVEAGFTCQTQGSANDGPSVCLAICGDGLVVATEECDDGNTQPGDGCSPDCRQEVQSNTEMSSVVGITVGVVVGVCCCFFIVFAIFGGVFFIVRSKRQESGLLG